MKERTKSQKHAQEIPYKEMEDYGLWLQKRCWKQ